MLKKSPFSPTQPRRAETRRSACTAAASEGAKRKLFLLTPPIACRNRRFPRPYVEPLSDVRTTLADFFSILLEFQEIAEQIFSDGRQNRFRMELDPFDTECLMADPHDLTFSGFGGNLTTIREIDPIDDERMIARRFKRIG